MKLSCQIRRLVLNSIRMYFAPLIGAFKGIRAEMHRVDREIALHRQDEDQPKKRATYHA